MPPKRNQAGSTLKRGRVSQAPTSLSALDLPTKQGTTSNHKANSSRQRSPGDPNASPHHNHTINNYRHPSPTARQPLPKRRKRAPPSPRPSHSYIKTTTINLKHLLHRRISRTRNPLTASTPHPGIPNPSASSSTLHKVTRIMSKTRKGRVSGDT